MAIKNKKAQASQSTYFMVAAFFTCFMIIAFILLVSRYQTQKIVLDQDLVRDIYLARIINNPNCFAYFDEDIQRTYPGLIDPNKINDDTLKECYKVCGVKNESKTDLFGIKRSDGEECLSKFGFNFILDDKENSVTRTAKTENFVAFSRTIKKAVLLYYPSGIKAGELEIQVQRTLEAIKFEGQKNKDED